MEPEEDGPEELHPFETVVQESGVVFWEYQCMCLETDSATLTEQQQVEVVPICFILGKLLVAVPVGAWHRTVAKRLLPRAALSKACQVEVGFCAPHLRELAEEGDLVKVWMGFLAEPYVSQLASITEEVEIGMAFGEGEQADWLPSADGLVAAAQEHFAFESATSGLESQREAGAATGGGHGGVSGLETGKRLDRVENLLEKLSVKLDSLMEPQGVKAAPSSSRPSALRKSSKSVNENYPDLDPGVVAAAISAGVDEESLRAMQKMMQGGQKKQQKLADPGKTPPGLRVKLPPAGPLSESEPEDEEKPSSSAVGGSGHRSSGGGESPMADAVTKLAEIVSVLTADKMRKGRSSVEAALDGISASSVTESGSLGSGKRAAAARRALRTALQETPTEIYQLLERAMLEDLTSQTLVPGQPAPQLCSRAWIEHRSKIGHWKSSAYCAWTVGGALDALIKGDTAGCRARLCLMLLMLDQTACDRGSWSLSAELSLESPPPMAVLSQHQPPAVADGEQPFSRLLDPRWAEIAMAHVKETEEFVTRRQKLGKKDQGEGNHGGGSGDTRAKAKAKTKAGDKTGAATPDH